MNHFLETLYYRRYRIHFSVARPFAFEGYPYHLVRGILGKILRDEACVKPGDESCTACSENRNCPYTAVFEVKLPDSHPLRRRYTAPPVPYIIYPELGGKLQCKTGDAFSIELTLIGSATDYDTFLLLCLQRISEGEGLLYRKLACTGIETMVGDDKKSRLGFTAQPETVNRLKLHFVSPVILKIKEESVRTIPFDVLAERLTERLALLSHLYCGADMPDVRSFRNPVQTDNYIDSFYPVPVEIPDGGNKKSPPKEGLLGSVAYNGNIGEYMPVIRAGEILHLGGYPNYGLGKYAIDEASLT